MLGGKGIPANLRVTSDVSINCHHIVDDHSLPIDSHLHQPSTIFTVDTYTVLLEYTCKAHTQLLQYNKVHVRTVGPQ